MSEQNSNFLPEKVVEIIVQQVLKRNTVHPEEVKKNISEDQKQMLREMVQDLKKQVQEFNKGNKNKTKTSDE